MEKVFAEFFPCGVDIVGDEGDHRCVRLGK
jgi:hypothetical protein